MKECKEANRTQNKENKCKDKLNKLNDKNNNPKKYKGIK